jgi:hypothetical protein
MQKIDSSSSTASRHGSKSSEDLLKTAIALQEKGRAYLKMEKRTKKAKNTGFPEKQKTARLQTSRHNKKNCMPYFLARQLTHFLLDTKKVSPNFRRGFEIRQGKRVEIKKIFFHGNKSLEIKRRHKNNGGALIGRNTALKVCERCC